MSEDHRYYLCSMHSCSKVIEAVFLHLDASEFCQIWPILRIVLKKSFLKLNIFLFFVHNKFPVTFCPIHIFTQDVPKLPLHTQVCASAGRFQYQFCSRLQNLSSGQSFNECKGCHSQFSLHKCLYQIISSGFKCWLFLDLSNQKLFKT